MAPPAPPPAARDHPDALSDHDRANIARRIQQARARRQPAVTITAPQTRRPPWSKERWAELAIEALAAEGTEAVVTDDPRVSIEVRL